MSTTEVLRSQWQNPADIFSVLLIIGGDVVQKALAQLSGYFLVPVAFSFGWVAYSFITLMSVVGGGRLMPLPDHPAKVINVENGYTRENKSWILGRLLRDFESPLANDIGLSITVFNAVDVGMAARPTMDWCWASGIVVILIQLGIAIIPWKLYKDWGIFLATACGTVLALLTGALPQWRFEKWACRKNTKKTLIVTGGNGTRHVMVIIGDGKGLDLEDLAGGESPRLRREPDGGKFLSRSSKFLIIQVLCAILAAVWIVFLITVVGLKQNVWYLLGVGGLGMIQNVVVAGARREMGTKGIHLGKAVGEFKQKKVMRSLMECEKKYNGVGKCLLNEFFPGALTPKEKEWWDGVRTEDDKARTKSEDRRDRELKEIESGEHQLDSNPNGEEPGDRPIGSFCNDQRV